MYKYLGPSVALIIIGFSFVISNGTPIYGESSGLRLKSSSIISEFPNGFRISAEASGVEDVKAIVVHLQMGQVTRGAFRYLCAPKPEGVSESRNCNPLTPSNLVKGELFWRTDTAARYIPPGTAIKYHFAIEGISGQKFVTGERVFIYEDARFKWNEVTNDIVTVSYHGPVKKRAEVVLEAIHQTMITMQPVLGFEKEEPIRVTIYNNNREMLGALPSGSETTRRELITEGQAYGAFGVLIMLAGGRRARGTASHEVTHILVHRVGDSIFRRVPLWLNEGLAEYANVEPGYSYDIALDFAIGTNTMLPSFLRAYPGEPEKTIIFYGQARSIVRYMIHKWGHDKMRQLMSTMKTGKGAKQAIEEVYGVTMKNLDDAWRASIGAEPYVASEEGSKSKPTAVPLPKLGLYSLTPKPDTQVIQAKTDTPTHTPEPSPTSTSTPEPIPTLPAPSPTASPSEPITGTGCLAIKSNPGAGDASTLSIILGLLGLRLRSIRNRRG